MFIQLFFVCFFPEAPVDIGIIDCCFFFYFSIFLFIFFFSFLNIYFYKKNSHFSSSPKTWWRKRNLFVHKQLFLISFNACCNFHHFSFSHLKRRCGSRWFLVQLTLFSFGQRAFDGHDLNPSKNRLICRKFAKQVSQIGAEFCKKFDLNAKMLLIDFEYNLKLFQFYF